MLAVPGWRDRASEPNAVLVVSAENITARAVAEPRKRRDAAAPVHDEIDVERHADAEQQRQGDDVGEIQAHADSFQQQRGQQRGDAAAAPCTSTTSSARRSARARMIAMAMSAL